METFEEILITLSHLASMAPNLPDDDAKLYFKLPHAHHGGRVEKPRYVSISRNKALNAFLCVSEWQLATRAWQDGARQDALVRGRPHRRFEAGSTVCHSPAATMLRLWELTTQPRNRALLSAGWMIDLGKRCLAEPDNIRIHSYAMSTVRALRPEMETYGLLRGIARLILVSVHAATEEHSRIVPDHAQGPGLQRFSYEKTEGATANDGGQCQYYLAHGAVDRLFIATWGCWTERERGGEVGRASSGNLMILVVGSHTESVPRSGVGRWLYE